MSKDKELKSEESQKGATRVKEAREELKKSKKEYMTAEKEYREASTQKKRSKTTDPRINSRVITAESLYRGAGVKMNENKQHLTSVIEEETREAKIKYDATLREYESLKESVEKDSKSLSSKITEHNKKARDYLTRFCEQD